VLIVFVVKKLNEYELHDIAIEKDHPSTVPLPAVEHDKTKRDLLNKQRLILNLIYLLLLLLLLL
jgi:hypothetical protein